MKKLFGTDGIRGKAGEFPLDPQTIQTIGRSLAELSRERLDRTPRFVTGRDTRESGDWIEAAFHAGARGAGAEVLSAGVITTPGVAFVTGHGNFDGGIVISASHNPFEDNGLKIFNPSGKKAHEGTERAIEKDIYSANGNTPAAAASVDLSRIAEFRETYLKHLEDGFSGLDLTGKRIIVDCANGAASHLAPALFEHFGAEVNAIHCAPDGRNINLDCGSLHLEHLQQKVVAENADLGVAFDGDADRSLFVNDLGEIVDGDAVLWVMARYLKAHGGLPSNKVIATVMSNVGLELALKGEGIELVRTAVGDKYVLEELMTSAAELGGEQSGHIIFPRRSLVGDGMLTALYLVQAIGELGGSLSKAAQGFARYPQILINVHVREKLPFDDVDAIRTAAAEVEQRLNGTGRLLLRYSGTENLARVMIEGKDQTEIDALANGLADVIRQQLA
ncbi:MAG: phosphoglucosamine mutase [bacterium]|nr:phosphoglucosamine mutase [bacterium]